MRVGVAEEITEFTDTRHATPHPHPHPYRMHIGNLTFRRDFSFRTSVVFKTYHFYDNNIVFAKLEKYGYSERSSKNKRMFVMKI
jgi:hypothetical protein